MAANLCIKSESWLNLAIDQTQLCHESRAPKAKLISGNSNRCKLQKRHSIGGNQNYYSQVASSETSAKELRSSNCSLANPAGQHHLLIRLRQQSYHLNRSSMTTLSSNLSNSVELNSTLLNAGDLKRAELNTGNLRELETKPKNKQLERQIKLKNEPKKLQLIKNKLQKGGRLFGGRDPADGGFARSWSSLSDRINGKLVNIRHSWKHFLYHYNHNETVDEDQTKTDLPRGEQHRRRSSEADEALRSVNKSQLTNDWIARHYCFAASDRPKSLQITSSTPPPHLKHLSSASRDELNFTFYNSHQLTPPTNQQVARQRQFKQSAHADSVSSTTLVSQRISSAQLEEPIQTGQPTDNEDEGRSLESLSSSGSSRRPRSASVGPRAPSMSKPSLPAIVVTRRDEGSAQTKKNCKEHKLPSEKSLKQAPTSDYWSTVTTGTSGDYYLRQPNMAPQQLQVVGSSHPDRPSSNNFVGVQQQPILVADQDYYLEVARASQQQFNAAASNRFLAAPQQVGVVPPHNQQLETQMFIQPPINLANLTHTDMATFLSQQQRQMQPQQVLREDDYDEDYAEPADESCRLDRNQVELVQMIGEGQKGFVFLGKLQSKDGQHISDVAIKTLKYETDQLIEKLMREAAMMRQLEHPHIIKFIGVCPETPALIAMELAEFGEVKQYLKLHKHLIYTSQLILFTFQISTALSYLESKHYVHRDVAARNVLVCSHNCVKLADFGLSRNLQVANQPPNQLMDINSSKHLQLINEPADSDKSHYVAATKGKLPVRWLAPESLAFRRFTSASDVWMFAVCSWELFQYGELRPWSHIRNNQVLLAIESGQRLAQPFNCPMRLYQLMLQCWSYAPVQRPKFRDLKQNLWSIYLNERARERHELEQLQLHHQHQQQQQQQQQRALLVAANWQQQERLNQVVDNKLTSQHKQQNLLNQQQIARNLHRVTRQTNIHEDQLVNDQRFLVQANPHQPPADPQTAATNTMNSNFSGYSSTTATAEHSNNSSRSSSMGSLARNQSLRARQQKQHQSNRMQPAMLNNQSHLLPLSKATELKECECPREPAELEAAEMVMRDKLVDANLKRFHKTPGRVLQKQRSQSSIINDLSKSNVLQQDNPGRKTKYGYDDHALLPGSDRTTLLQINVMEEEDDGYKDEDEDEDSSDAEPGEISRLRSVARSGAQKLPPNEHHMRLLTGLVQHVRIEPTYEGIHNGSVAMIKGERCSSMKRRSDKGGHLWRRPDEFSGPQKPDDSEEEMMKREQKLSDTLQALKITPLKAKLSLSGRQSSLEPSGRQSVGDRLGNNRSNGSSPKELIASRGDPKNQAQSQEELEQAQENDRQRIALHQRLLGRIRPISGNKNPQRRSINMDQRQNSASGGDTNENLANSEKVDQSLEILESLISEKNFSNNKITPNDRKAHYQAKLLRDMNSNLQVELRHRLKSRRLRAKGFSFPNHEL